MLSRPVDASGDILPVLSPDDLFSGPAAVGAGLRDHLQLYPGDWWEYPDRGNPILDLLSVSRRTDQSARTLSSALTAFVQSFPGVRSVSQARSSFSGRRFIFSCAAHPETGEDVPVEYIQE